MEAISWKSQTDAQLKNYKLKVLRLCNSSPVEHSYKQGDYSYWFDKLKQMGIDIDENISQTKVSNPFGESSPDEIADIVCIKIFRQYRKRIESDKVFRNDLEEAIRLRVMGFVEVIDA